MSRVFPYSLFSCFSDFYFATIMSCFAKVKCFLACIVLYYISYLYNYKCPTLTPLQEGVETILHPLHSHHSVLCDYLHTGINTVEPYTAKVHGFLDDHVHSHPLFIEYKVEDKLTCAKNKFSTYVYPYIHQLYQFTDVAEVHAHEHLSQVYDKVQKTLKQD